MPNGIKFCTLVARKRKVPNQVDTYRSECMESLSQQDKLDGIKQVALSRTIASHDNIGRWRKRLDLRLLSERSEIGYCNLFDVHGVVQSSYFICWL